MGHERGKWNNSLGKESPVRMMELTAHRCSCSISQMTGECFLLSPWHMCTRVHARVFENHLSHYIFISGWSMSSFLQCKIQENKGFGSLIPSPKTVPSTRWVLKHCITAWVNEQITILFFSIMNLCIHIFFTKFWEKSSSGITIHVFRLVCHQRGRHNLLMSSVGFRCIAKVVRLFCPQLCSNFSKFTSIPLRFS